MRETIVKHIALRRFYAVLAVVFIGLFLCPAAWGSQSVSLTWDAAPAGSTAGYFLYCGPSSGYYTLRVDVGNNTTATISGLTSGQTNYFVVTAYSQSRIEGLPSNEAMFVVPYPPLNSIPQMAVVSPGSGGVGGQVFIYGSNFTTAVSVQFGGINASFNTVSDSLIVATIPAYALSGALTVSTSGGGLAAHPFVIIPTTPPANDNFASAQTLTGTMLALTTNTAGASWEFGEPMHAGMTGGSSVWYRWTAPSTGVWSLAANGSDFTVLLGVYTGNILSSLTSVASNKNSAGNLTNALTFNAVAGVTYQIAADGYGGASGNLVLCLAPTASTLTLFSTSFEGVEGYSQYLPVAGESGWLSSGNANSGVKNNYFNGYGQQAYLGYGSTTTPATTSSLYQPITYTLDTNNRPVIQFSTMMQMINLLNRYTNAFAWAARNAAGHELFRVTFDNATKMVSYTLDNNAGPVNTGVTFDNLTAYNFLITMDYARKRWSASLNGIALATEQPLTTVGAALTFGDVDAVETFKNPSSPGTDALLFDNYQITAGPTLVPKILLGLHNQNAIAGGNAFLAAAAIGATPMSYQWYLNSAAIPNATNTGLSLQNLISSQGGNYTVVISNAYGSASSTAALTVASSPPKAAFSATTSLGCATNMLNLTVAPNNSYRFQASTNLTTWTTLATFFANTTNVLCFDPLATNYPRRFYRVVSP